MELFLYSTQAYICWHLNHYYYYGVHWVYCSECFHAQVDGMVSPPPSSTPKLLLDRYRMLAEADDVQDPKLVSLRAGLRKGAKVKKRTGILSDDLHREVTQIIGSTRPNHYRPVLYIIRRDVVTSRMQTVPVKRRANPLAFEYVIPDLKETEFEALFL